MKRKQNKKQANKSLTFIVIPPGIDKTWRLNVKKKMLVGMLSVLIAIAAASFTVGYLYYDSQMEIRQVNNLKESNQEKDNLIESLSNSIEEIETQQQSIESKQEQIKKMMGVKTEATTTQPSRGGQGGADMLQVDMEVRADALQRAEAISTNLYLQEKELDELIARVSNNQEYFRSIPNVWPVEGEITSEFGWRNSPFGGRGTSFHNGLDIANNVGTDIYAAADGTVTSSGWQAVYGKTIEISHGYGFQTMYGHNYVLLVKVGDKVTKGQVIARMGNTGRSTGPHLHFSIFKNGQALNPMVYLLDR